MVLAASVTVAAPSRSTAQLTSTDPASILFFPLVVADGPEDTLLQISNASNNQVNAQCFFVEAAAGLLQTTDFFLTLTRQQPTQWIVSSGRPFDDTDPRCSPGALDCFGAGLDPGGIQFPGAPRDELTVPPAPAGFRGALLCVLVDQSGSPFGANTLHGQATFIGGAAGDVFTYTAVASLANPDLFGSEGNVLRLDNTPTTDGQADGCPQAFLLSHLFAGAEDPLLGSGSAVTTRITAMPCSLDLAAGQAPDVTLDFEVTTDLEETFSTSTTVQGWLDASLTDIDDAFQVGTLGSTVARTRITASPGGAVIVGSETRSDGSRSVRTGVLLHRDNEQRIDAIVLPNP